jgi:hypothetical protein
MVQENLFYQASKKIVVLARAEFRVLRDARAVIFTCEEERILAWQSFLLYQS